METRTLKLQEITPENIAGYGTLIDAGIAEPLADTPLFKYWNDLSVASLDGGVCFGVVETRPSSLACTAFERHVKTSETLIPMNGDVVLVMGKPTPGDYPDPKTVAAFRLPQGKAVTLDPGTWHFAPLAAGKPVKSMVVFKQGTPDNDLLVREMDQDKNITFQVQA